MLSDARNLFPVCRSKKGRKEPVSLWEVLSGHVDADTHRVGIERVQKVQGVIADRSRWMEQTKSDRQQTAEMRRQMREELKVARQEGGQSHVARSWVIGASLTSMICSSVLTPSRSPRITASTSASLIFLLLRRRMI